MTRAQVLDGIVGVAAVGIGALFALRPFGSVPLVAAALAVGLIVAGVGEATRAVEGVRPLRYAGASALVATGVVLLAWQGLSIVSVAVVSGVGLIAWAATRFAAAVPTGDPVMRIADALLGVAAVALAVTAFAWPGVTIFAATFVAGVALIWFGLTRLYRIARRPAEGTGRPHRVLRLVTAVVAALVAIPLAVVSIGVHRASPEPDDFYSAPLDPAAEPGTLLRTEDFHRDVPDNARAWRILYTTTRDDGVPALASAIVVAPKDPPPGPRPVIAWAHGTTGAAPGCAPSVLEHPFTAGATPALPEVIASGSVMVATDYTGLGTEGPTPYLIGQGEARAVLDSVRAARGMRQLRLSPRTVVWGHSQGGHAALWTGIIAPTYAPDVEVSGVAAMAPASDLLGLADKLMGMTGGAVFGSYVLDAYSRTYDDVDFDDYVDVQARLPLHAMATRCLSEPAVVASVIEALLVGADPYGGSLDDGPLRDRLVQNTPSAKLTMPLLLAQGDADDLISPQGQKSFAAHQCAVGTNVDFRTYPGLGHVPLVDAGSPAVDDLLAWTAEIIEGRTPAGRCPQA